MFNVGTKLRVLSAIVIALTVSACGAPSGGGTNIQIQGVRGPTVSYVNGDFLMSVALENVTVDGGLRMPVPHFPNSYIEVGPDLQSNGMLVTVGISAADLAAMTGVNILDPQSLPGGRPLPGVAQGTLPAVAVQVPKWDNMVFYVGPQIFGVFVPVKLGMQGYIATFRFYDNNGNNIGNISLVGEDTANKNSGFLVLIPIQGAVGSIVKAAALK